MSRAQAILKQYSEIQKKQKEDLEYRKSSLYSKIPRLAEIERDMTKLSIDISKLIINNSSNAASLLAELHQKQIDLKVERAEILTSNNYPRDYLEIKHLCKECKDTGFVNNEKCKCFIQKEIDLLYQQSNMHHKMKKENFDQFRLDYYSDEKNENGISARDNMKEIYMKCVKYAKNFDKHNTNLLFIGKPGLGKTFLCNSIAKDLLDAGKSVIYQTASDLIDMVRKYKFDFENEEQNTSHLEEIFNCDLLIIDDLGTEINTQFSGLVLYNILNRRFTNKKQIIISTNLDIHELLNMYSERITSRLFGGFDTFEFFGEDIRLKMHKII